MNKVDSTFLSADGKTQIHVRKWIPDEEPKAVLQIIHGMVEFIGRYSEFASFLTDHGYLVVGHDHLGHGESVVNEESYGYFGKDGNANVIQDIHTLRKLTQEEYPDIPYIMMGHSMGSFLIRQYITEQEEDGTVYAEGLAGAVVMGTGWQPGAALVAGKGLSALLSIFGSHYRSKVIDNMALGSYNKHFKPARTRNDWLTKDTEVVDWYCEEEWCNFKFTVNAYYNLFKGMQKCQSTSRMKRLPEHFRIFFVSGAEDPVGNFGEGVRKAYMKYIENTKCDLDIRLYEDDRHEILNETDKEKVYGHLLTWMDESVEIFTGSQN